MRCLFCFIDRSIAQYSFAIYSWSHSISHWLFCLIAVCLTQSILFDRNLFLTLCWSCFSASPVQIPSMFLSISFTRYLVFLLFLALSTRSHYQLMFFLTKFEPKKNQNSEKLVNIFSTVWCQVSRWAQNLLLHNYQMAKIIRRDCGVFGQKMAWIWFAIGSWSYNNKSIQTHNKQKQKQFLSVKSFFFASSKTKKKNTKSIVAYRNIEDRRKAIAVV